MSSINRRDFMKTAGIGAGVAAAAGYSPFAYAQNEKVNVACVGTGGQGTFHIRDGLAGAENIQIVAVCDVLTKHLRASVPFAMTSNAGIKLAPGERPQDMAPEQLAKAKAAYQPKMYHDYREMLAREKDLDAVIISTPLHTHFEITMACLDAGKWVFCEKTLTQTIEEGRQVVEKCHETGKFCAVGHQRRYNPKYNLGMKIAFEGAGKLSLGRINHITTQWHRNAFWRRNIASSYYPVSAEEAALIRELAHVDVSANDLEKLLNWRMYEKTSGGLFTELATHQLDIANWFMKTLPSRVFATGSLDYWRDGREVDDNIELVLEYDQKPGDAGFSTIDQRSKLQNMAWINKAYTVRHAHSNILANAKRGAAELLEGDWGTLELSEQDCFMYLEPAPIAERARAESAEEEGKEASADSIMTGASLQVSNEELKKGIALLADRRLETADVYQFRAFAHHIKNGGVPRNNQMVGYTTTVSGQKAIESRQKGEAVAIDPALLAFDFETPSFYDWEYDENIGELIEQPAEEAVPADENA
jgi:predicted dehydrogenase